MLALFAHPSCEPHVYVSAHLSLNGPLLSISQLRRGARLLRVLLEVLDLPGLVAMHERDLGRVRVAAGDYGLFLVDVDYRFY